MNGFIGVNLTIVVMSQVYNYQIDRLTKEAAVAGARLEKAKHELGQLHWDILEEGRREDAFGSPWPPQRLLAIGDNHFIVKLNGNVDDRVVTKLEIPRDSQDRKE